MRVTEVAAWVFLIVYVALPVGGGLLAGLLFLFRMLWRYLGATNVCSYDWCTLRAGHRGPHRGG